MNKSIKNACVNHSIAKAANTVKFKVGAKFIATIKAVRDEGVNIVMPNGRGAGLISPRYFGEGTRRRAALAAIHPGDEMPVVVKKLYPQTMTLLLAPDADSESCQNVGNVASKAHEQVGVQRKPDYELLPHGTTFLVDCANLLGDIGPEDATRRLRTIRDSLVSFGHSAAFFLEHRACTWLKCNQESEAKAEAFTRFVAEAGVSLVQGEVDLAILQCTRQIPGSVCLSNDGFADYRNVFGDLVGTSRIRSFSWATIADSLFLSIDGLADAIVIKPEERTDTSAETSIAQKGIATGGTSDTPEVVDETEDKPAVAEVEQPVESINDIKTPHRRPDAPANHEAILALGNEMLTKGNEKKGVACFAKAGEDNPLAWAELAWMYHDGTGVKADKSRARRFFRKAREMAAKKRQCRIRLARARLRKNRFFDHATFRGCAA